MVRLSVEHVHGPKKIAYGPDELVVVCLVRNARPYIRSFIDHYLSLGVKHIVFLDNGSDDETVSIARDHERVTVLRTELPYKKYKYAMKQYLISRFGKGRWSLYVDHDELFDYPYSDVVGLSSLLRYLNEKSYTTVVAHMLDMFSERPLLSRTGQEDEPLKGSYKLYDLSNIEKEDYGRRRGRSSNVVANDDVKVLKGGIRKTLFDVTPLLTKHPLIFFDGEVRPMDNSSHSVKNARVADFSCVLYHYKFVDGFREQVERAVREENYFRDSARYKKYREVLERNPNIRVEQDTARELGSVNELIDDGFLVVSDEYRKWADAEKEKRRRARAEERNTEVGQRLVQDRLGDEVMDPSQGVEGVEVVASRGARSHAAQANGLRAARREPRGPEDVVAKPLFIAGCQRSGTTALADYLNQHQEVLVCKERYKYVPEEVTADHLTFERILDYGEGETNVPREYHVELLGSKDPAKLKWIGDKNPGYFRHFESLQRHNPGAHFIVLYRSVEEVAESFEARARDVRDHWPGHLDFEKGVRRWNLALRKTRDFIENSSDPRVLIVGYHDFFYQNDACVPLISRFLGLEFDESMRKAWGEMSLRFERERRCKEPISGERATFIRENKDHAIEEWVLDRIDKQRSELYVDERADTVLTPRNSGTWKPLKKLGQIKARAFGKQRRA